jgi:hypothetical protein
MDIQTFRFERVVVESKGDGMKKDKAPGTNFYEALRFRSHRVRLKPSVPNSMRTRNKPSVPNDKQFQINRSFLDWIVKCVCMKPSDDREESQQKINPPDSELVIAEWCVRQRGRKTV